MELRPPCKCRARCTRAAVPPWSPCRDRLRDRARSRGWRRGRETRAARCERARTRWGEMAISSTQLEEHAPLCAQSVPGGKEPQLRYFMEPPVQLISCRGAIPATSMACEEEVAPYWSHAYWQVLCGLGTYLEHRRQCDFTLHVPKRLTRHLTKGKLRVRWYVPETVQGHEGHSEAIRGHQRPSGELRGDD